MLSGNTENRITVTYDDNANKINFSVDDMTEDNYVDSVFFTNGTLTIGRTGSLPDLTTTITATGVGGVSNVTVDYTGRSAPCTLPITVTEPITGTKQINIPSNSNAFGAKYVQNSEPTGSSICDGDIWYDTTPGTGGGGGVSIASTDKIFEGNSKAEIIDTVSESKFTVHIDNAEKFSVDIGGPKIHRQDNSNEGGSIVLNRAADDVAAFELDVYGSSSSDSGVFRIIDATGGGERFLIGPAGQIGLGGANYGSTGQVLTSGGPGAGVTWADASGGGTSDPVGTIVAWAGSVASIPSEYQLCDGGTASTSALQAITGANVPDLRDKFIVGATNSTGDTTYPGLSPGATGGSANAVLLSHEHTTENFVARSNYAEPRNFGVGTDGNLNNAGDTNNIGIDESGTTQTDGSVTGTNKNLPPYYALCYIIKHTATASTTGIGSTGNGITIQDEGNPLSTDAFILNFEGSGVTATGTGSTKTITIGGGESSYLTVFVNSGTFTPPAGTSSHIVWVTGAGGGSGAARGEYDDSSINGFSGSGGGGATVVRRYSSAEMGNSALVTVGSGGNGGNSGSGGTGGTSTFNPGGTGTTLTANGGVGSGYANETTTNGGAGGGGSGGQYGFNGDPGLRGNYGGGSGHFEEGGSSFYGKNTYGSGGDGRRRYGSGTQNGQSGNGGIVVVQSF